MLSIVFLWEYEQREIVELKNLVPEADFRTCVLFSLRKTNTIWLLFVAEEAGQPKIAKLKLLAPESSSCNWLLFRYWAVESESRRLLFLPLGPAGGLRRWLADLLLHHEHRWAVPQMNVSKLVRRRKLLGRRSHETPTQAASNTFSKQRLQSNTSRRATRQATGRLEVNEKAPHLSDHANQKQISVLQNGSPSTLRVDRTF